MRERYLNGGKLCNALQTSAKTIVGAVNELWNRPMDYINGIKHVTYAQLTSMRDAGELVTGQWYRITDYETTVANGPDARSAGHPFDLLVMATSNTTLSEEARAIKSSRDQGYFANSNLDAWKIWYCLDNDATRFAWADTENGTGVIFRMIDEWNNDCPYDFKNVQFKRYLVVDLENVPSLVGKYFATTGTDEYTLPYDEENYIWAYTFSMPYTELKIPIAEYIDSNGYDLILDEWENVDNDEVKIDFKTQEDSSLNRYKGGKVAKGYVNGCRRNTIEECYTTIILDNDVFMTQALNNIVTYSCLVIEVDNYTNPSINQSNNTSNKFHLHCYNITLGFNCINNEFKNSCCYNTFGNFCESNIIGTDFKYNTFGNGCSWNQFGNSCESNQFGNNVYNNQFGNYVRTITVFDGVQYVSVTGTESNSTYVQNAQILNGTSGSNSNNMLQISFQVNAKYSQIAGLKSDGELRIWNPADGV